MKEKIEKVLVTGSSGMIGTALCEELIKKGYEVTGVDLRPNRWSERVNRVTVISDLTDRSFFDKLSSHYDLVIHLAANARVFKLVKDPTMARDNFEMLFNVLEFCRLNMIKRIMFASSREVYGNLSGTLHAEDDVSIKHCESPYTATKIAGEALVTAYHQCYKMGFIILRFSNVYGKYDDSDRVVPNFIRVARLGKDLVVFGRDKLLDFTYISDCISGIVKSIEAFDRVKDNTFNIASGKGTTIVEVAQLIQSKIGTGGKIVIEENRKGEVVKFVADITKARQVLNYEPQIGIALGLDKTIEYYNSMEEAK